MVVAVSVLHDLGVVDLRIDAQVANDEGLEEEAGVVEILEEWGGTGAQSGYGDRGADEVALDGGINLEEIGGRLGNGLSVPP